MYYAVEYPNHAAAFGWSVGMILVGAVFAVVGLGMLIDYRGMSSRYLDINARIKQSFGLRARLEEDWRGFAWICLWYSDPVGESFGAFPWNSDPC
jgi:hypothetical protein